MDRAIDLYALGKDTFGPPERRAAAYAYVIELFLDASQIGPVTLSRRDPLYPLTCQLSPALLTPGPPEKGVLPGLIDLLRPLLPVSDPVVAAAVQDLLTFAGRVWLALEKISDAASIRMDIGGSDGRSGFIGGLTQDSNDRTIDLTSLTKLWAAVQRGQAAVRQVNPPGLTAPPTVQAFLEILQQELCVQRDAEERWENLVKSMAPNCFGLDGVFDVMGQFIRIALAQVSGETCPPFAPTIPPHFETSLAAGAFFTGSAGEGRS